MKMLVPKRYPMLGLVVVGLAGLWLTLPQDSLSPICDRGPAGYGLPNEAFNAARAAVKDYILTIDSDAIRIDPPFRANLHSQSKLWTIKGYAGCPKNEKKSYRWTVILSYSDQQGWEVLAKIVTPEFPTPNTNQIDGTTNVEGILFSPDAAR